MKKIVLLAATALAMTLGAYGSANATERGLMIEARSSYHHNDRDYNARRHVLKPQQVSRIVQRQGYKVRSMRYDRGDYFVTASKRHGRQVMLIVDGRSGYIKGERPIRRHY